MARSKSVEVANRDLRIIQLVGQGYTYDQISKMESISRSRISQIVHSRDQEIPDEEYRSKIVTKLESLLHDVVEPHIHGPGKVMVASGTGRVIVYPAGHEQEGEVVYDPSFKLEAVRVASVLLKDIAKMRALEKNKPLIVEDRQVDTTLLDRMLEEHEQVMQELQKTRAKLELYEAGEIVEADVVEDPAVAPSHDDVISGDDGISS